MTTQAKTAGNSQCAIAAQSAQHTPTPDSLQASHNRMVCTLRDFIEGQEGAVRKGADVAEVLAQRCKMSVERAKDDLDRAIPLCGTDLAPSHTLATCRAELAAVKDNLSLVIKYWVPEALSLRAQNAELVAKIAKLEGKLNG